MLLFVGVAWLAGKRLLVVLPSSAAASAVTLALLVLLFLGIAGSLGERSLVVPVLLRAVSTCCAAASGAVGCLRRLCCLSGARRPVLRWRNPRRTSLLQRCWRVLRCSAVRLTGISEGWYQLVTSRVAEGGKGRQVLLL